MELSGRVECRTGRRSVEVSDVVEAEWFAHVNETAAGTLLPNSDSWYLGANVPGKPRFFMIYLGGVAKFNEIIDKVAIEGYRPFAIA
jgi:cyclohexanone monooxygenase